MIMKLQNLTIYCCFYRLEQTFENVFVNWRMKENPNLKGCLKQCKHLNVINEFIICVVRKFLVLVSSNSWIYLVSAFKADVSHIRTTVYIRGYVNSRTIFHKRSKINLKFELFPQNNVNGLFNNLNFKKLTIITI